ncbi:MAG TPA: twin-arginine translocation signal domain-containing protein, partial [Rubrobacter sp.]|nr:twin-arginine translocation signal domain-containing protein [Rubrobacter sp.]
MERSRKVLRVAAVLSVVAALAHLWAVPEHFREWWGYGLFFLVAAAGQGFYGGLLPGRPRPYLLLLGVAGNLAVVALYVVTRTVGVPFFGPHAGEIEGTGALGLVATAAEIALVVALAGLWRFGPTVGRVGVSPAVRGADVVRAGGGGEGFSRRDFLRTAGVAGALGVSGGALGLRAAGV